MLITRPSPVTDSFWNGIDRQICRRLSRSIRHKGSPLRDSNLDLYTPLVAHGSLIYPQKRNETRFVLEIISNLSCVFKRKIKSLQQLLDDSTASHFKRFSSLFALMDTLTIGDHCEDNFYCQNEDRFIAFTRSASLGSKVSRHHWFAEVRDSERAKIKAFGDRSNNFWNTAASLDCLMWFKYYTFTSYA